MENKIVFVAREGLAIRNIGGQFTTFSGAGSVTAVLEGLKATLATIPTNVEGLAQEFITVYLPDIMNGLLSNSIGLYLRTGKTSSGRVIDQAELNLYVEVFNMLTERSLNVRLYNVKFVSKDDTVTKTLIKNTWAVLDREERKLLMSARVNAGAMVGVGAQVNTQQPSPEMIAMQQQMAMMQQMMQGVMSMLGGQMTNGQMPAMTPAMPTATTTATTTPDLGQPTALDINLGATTATATTETPAVAEYEPEF